MAEKKKDKTSNSLSGWGPRLADLADRLTAGRAMGGQDKLQRQYDRGEKDARQRIEALLDPGSFQELGTLVGSLHDLAPADAFPAGMGRIDGT